MQSPSSVLREMSTPVISFCLWSRCLQQSTSQINPVPAFPHINIMCYERVRHMPLRVMHVPHMDIVSLLDPTTSAQHVLDVCLYYICPKRR